MSVDLFCYTSLSKKEAAASIESLRKQHDALFAHNFVISSLRDANLMHKEIALEYGLVASCMFLISLNEKSAAGSMSTVSRTVKDGLGKSNVLLLLNNEIPY